MFPDSKYISPVVLIVDSDETNWRLDNDKKQSVDFLPTENLYDLIDDNAVPEDALQHCINLDKDYIYKPYPEILGAVFQRSHSKIRRKRIAIDARYYRTPCLGAII